MGYCKLGFILAITALATGCVSTNNYGQKSREISYEEAAAFEQALLSKKGPPFEEREKLFIQPVNKKEPCKLPTTQSQLDRSNFRTFWDGQCKNGYAYGLGRDIAISKTHHNEEITIHNGTDDNYSAPRVMYDYINNIVTYYIGENPYPKAIWYSERYSLVDEIYSVDVRVGSTDEEGNRLYKQSSPIDPRYTVVNERKNAAYRTMDISAVPIVEPATVVTALEILDTKTWSPGGIALVRHGTGQVRHVKVTSAGKEDVVAPKEYVAHLISKSTEAYASVAVAESAIERAKQIEREYMYMACNGKYEISGLDKEISTKICTWRDKFKTPHKVALEKMTHEMARLKERAEEANKQRSTQQQIYRQQAQLNQQQQNIELQQMANTLNQMGQQMRNSGQQALQSTMGTPTPQVSPWSAPSNQVRCVSAGSVTNCRY